MMSWMFTAVCSAIVGVMCAALVFYSMGGPFFAAVLAGIVCTAFAFIVITLVRFVVGVYRAAGN